MKKYREFTEEDWYGWGGAESFNDERGPLIYSKTMNEGLVELTVIADKWGIEISILADKWDERMTYYKNMKWNSIQAEGEMSRLVDYIEHYEYAPDLTYTLDHPFDDAVKGFDCVEDCEY